MHKETLQRFMRMFVADPATQPQVGACVDPAHVELAWGSLLDPDTSNGKIAAALARREQFSVSRVPG